jgi:hypothetical protein
MNGEVVDGTGFVAVARTWATQTILFALSVENEGRLPGPAEVVEQMFIRTENHVERLFAEAIAECGDDATPENVGMGFLKRVLAWVGDWHRRNQGPRPNGGVAGP